MKTLKVWLRDIPLVPLLLLLLLISREAAAQFRLRCDGFSALGGASSASNTNLLAIAGQSHPIGASSNANYILTPGFIPCITGLISSNAEIKPVVTSPQSIGAEFSVDIAISEVQNLFGVSFELNYTNTGFVDVVTPTSNSVTPGEFLGNNAIFFADVDEVAGKVSIGISRRAGQGGVNGSGVVARVKFRSLFTTPLGTEVLFSLSTLAAGDPGGNMINLVAANAAVTFSGIVVWPGDTNNDGVVNQADILPIGLCFAQTGPPRQNASINWVGQPATPWAREACTFADGNGDGIVNQGDVLPIGLNFGRTHTAGKTISEQPLAKVISTSSEATLTPDVSPPQQPPEQEFFIRIHALDVADLFGLAFELIYDRPELLQILTEEPDSLLGSGVIFFSNKTDGKVSVGITRKLGQSGVDGTGPVVRIKAMITTQAKNGDVINLSLQQVSANNANGQSIPMALQPSRIEVITTTAVASRQDTRVITDYRLHPNHPNPFNPGTLIQYEIPKTSEVVVKIYNFVGQEVQTLVNGVKEPGIYQTRWDGRDAQGRPVPSGVYLYRLHAGSFVATRKMILLH